MVDKQENFLQEIGAVRRRLSMVEEDAKRPVVPPLTRAHVQSIARETASAEGQEVLDNAARQNQWIANIYLKRLRTSSRLTQGHSIDKMGTTGVARHYIMSC